MNLSYFSAANLPSANFVFIVGPNRSGKTIIGNLLGSCANVEHIDEPWPLMQIVILTGQGVIPAETARDMFKTYLYELLNDRILMRNVNFRETDRSYIHHQKSKTEVAQRMALNTRAEVKEYLKTNSFTFIFTLTNTTPFLNLIDQFLPQSKIIFTVRRASEVAHEIVQKSWLSDEEARKPTHSNLLRKETGAGNTTQFIPWWISPEDIQSYLAKNENARALYYWMQQMDFEPLLESKLKNDSRLFIANFSELTGTPDSFFEKIQKFIPLKSTSLTEQQIRAIKSYSKITPAPLTEDPFNPAELQRFKQINARWQLPVEASSRTKV